MLEYLKPTLDWLHTHPHTAYLLTAFIAFSESLALVGLVVPGALLLVGIGTLVGSGIINPTETFVAAILGAILGDFISFWLGHHFRHRIHSIWPFRRWPTILKKGEAFFRAHGGKSVFLGRFLGPIRPVTPLIAGILKMRITPFIFIDVISAILWAFAYIFPGVLIGSAASAELTHEALSHFILIIFVVIIAIILLYWILHKIAFAIADTYHHFQNQLWYVIQHTPSLHLIKRLIHTPSLKEREHQTDLLLLLTFSLLFFVFITFEVVTHGFLNAYNEALTYFFRSLRTQTIDKVMIFITLLGEKQPMGALFVGAGVLLLWQRHFRTASYWFMNGLLIFGLTTLIKIFAHIHRPLGTKGALTYDWSYPSGHTAISIALLGFLAILLAEDLPRLARKYIYWFALTVALLIAFSRLYLGAHWLTDVLGGFFLGLATLSFTALLYRHKKIHIKPLLLTAVLALSTWLGAWGIVLITGYHKVLTQTQLAWPKESLTYDEWWHQTGATTSPFYRSNRFGKPVQTINIQLVGNIEALKTKLLANDWINLQDDPLKILFYRLSESQTVKLPFLIQQYLGQAPILVMYKAVDEDQLLILRLWKSTINIIPTQQIIIMGQVSYHRAWHPMRIIKKQPTPRLEGSQPALQVLFKDAEGASSLQLKMADFKQYPPLNEETDRDWNGLVLLIKTR